MRIFLAAFSIFFGTFLVTSCTPHPKVRPAKTEPARPLSYEDRCRALYQQAQDEYGKGHIQSARSKYEQLRQLAKNSPPRQEPSEDEETASGSAYGEYSEDSTESYYGEMAQQEINVLECISNFEQGLANQNRNADETLKLILKAMNEKNSEKLMNLIACDSWTGDAASEMYQTNRFQIAQTLLKSNSKKPYVVQKNKLTSHAEKRTVITNGENTFQLVIASNPHAPHTYRLRLVVVGDDPTFKKKK